MLPSGPSTNEAAASFEVRNNNNVKILVAIKLDDVLRAAGELPPLQVLFFKDGRIGKKNIIRDNIAKNTNFMISRPQAESNEGGPATTNKKLGALQRTLEELGCSEVLLLSDYCRRPSAPRHRPEEEY